MAKLKPGSVTPISGQYGIINAQGKMVGERTSVKGHTLPPTPDSGSSYVLVDRTKTKGK